MNDKSTRAYNCIDARATRLSKWIDNNIFRILIALSAVSIAWYGNRLPEGTFLRSLSPELLGIVITAVIIDYINELRQREQLKAQLIRQMGSSIREVAVPAARELEHHHWLYNGSLCGADLRGANLSRADLTGAKLRKTMLDGAILSRAYLRLVDLSEASMAGADLSEAVMLGANLSGVQLWGADLNNLKFWTIEQLEQATVLFGAIMPDGIQIEPRGIWDMYFENTGAPSFQEWKRQYLATYGGNATDTREHGKWTVHLPFTSEEYKGEYLTKHEAESEPTGESDNTADRQAESGSPAPF